MSYFPNSYFGGSYFPAAYFGKAILVSTRAVRVILPARFSDPDNRPPLRKAMRVVDDVERVPESKGQRGNAEAAKRFSLQKHMRLLVTQRWRESFGGYLR